jgi:hypothetical protein
MCVGHYAIEPPIYEKLVEKERKKELYKVETPIHDNDLILTPIIAPQSS